MLTGWGLNARNLMYSGIHRKIIGKTTPEKYQISVKVLPIVYFEMYLFNWLRSD